MEHVKDTFKFKTKKMGMCVEKDILLILLDFRSTTLLCNFHKYISSYLLNSCTVFDDMPVVYVGQRYVGS